MAKLVTQVLTSCFYASEATGLSELADWGEGKTPFPCSLRYPETEASIERNSTLIIHASSSV